MPTIKELRARIDALQDENRALGRKIDAARKNVDRWQEKVKDNRAKIAELRKRIEDKQDSGGKPRIVGWDVTKISPSNVFGALGPETKATTHYAASRRARNLDEGVALTRSFDSYHRSLGWGGLSYHYLIPDSGELILGRSIAHKGAHVLNTNSNNVGINFFCTTGDRPTKAQADTYEWLVANAHTSALPASHRTDRDLRQADIRGHKFWPGQSTACPGYFTPQNLRSLATNRVGAGVEWLRDLEEDSAHPANVEQFNRDLDGEVYGIAYDSSRLSKEEAEEAAANPSVTVTTHVVGPLAAVDSNAQQETRTQEEPMAAEPQEFETGQLEPALNTVIKETKSGYKTTEFWVAVAVSLLTVVDGIPLPEKAEGVVVAAIAIAYALSRGLAKQGVPDVEAPSPSE